MNIPLMIRQIRETGVTPQAKPEGGCVVYSCFSLDEFSQVLDRAGLVIDQLVGYGPGNGMSRAETRQSEAELCPHLLALCKTCDVKKCVIG